MNALTSRLSRRCFASPNAAMRVLGLFVVGLPAFSAMAQDGAEEQIPQWIVMVIVVLMLVLVLIASFKNAKRGHQD